MLSLESPLIPTYSFMVIIDYLEPKAKAWNSGNTKELNIGGNSTYVFGVFLEIECQRQFKLVNFVCDA